MDLELVKKFAGVATVLYETELRQLLIDDLEELECFLRQRQAELTSKESTFFAVYQDSQSKGKQGKQKEQYERLRLEIDQGVCQRQIEKITCILREL